MGDDDMTFRRFAACAAVLAAIASGGWVADAPGGQRLDARYFRIGAGGAAGTYFPIASLIAEGLTRPAGAECRETENCGAPGLIAVAQTSNGSVSNVRSVVAGELEAALVQSDVASWAYHGEAVFADEPRLASLRAIASLYTESLHVVVRRDLGIKSIAGLKGLRISLDEPGSGTLVDSRLVLAASGLEEADLHPEYVKPALAATRMVDGRLDGFMIIVGYPALSIERLAQDVEIDLVPVDRRTAEMVRSVNPFMEASSIPAGAYPGIGETATLHVAAQMVVDAALSEQLVYDVSRALWGERIGRLLRQGHPKGRLVSLDAALEGVTIPLHPGAARFYREAGLLPSAGVGQPRD